MVLLVSVIMPVDTAKKCEIDMKKFSIDEYFCVSKSAAEV